MQTKIYNKVVSQFETRKGFGKASEAIWQTMPIAPTSIPVRRASRCYNDAVPKQGFYVRVWRRRSFDHNSWGATPLLQRRRSVCSLTAYEGMHSFCGQLGVPFTSCRLATNENLHGLGCPYANRKNPWRRCFFKKTVAQQKKAYN